MANKRYVTVRRLSRFFDNLKNLFATKTSVDELSEDVAYINSADNESISGVETDNGAGKKLPVNGGEIFNDYENNDSNIPYAHITGKNNKAIIRCFKIIGFPGDYENKNTFSLTLDSVEGIQPGMSWNIFTPADSADGYKKWVYTILSVDKENNTITWSDPTVPSTVYRSVRELIAAGLTLSTGATFLNTFICAGGTIGSHIIEDIDNAQFSVTLTGQDNTGYLGAFVSGKGCKGSGFCAFVTGDRCQVTADRGAAFNYKTEAGSEAFAINLETKALGTGSFSQGAGTKALAKYSSSFGQGTETHCTNGMSRGQYNTIDEEGKYLDMVGNGSDAKNRSNAYTLDKEGNANFAGNATAKNGYFLGDEFYAAGIRFLDGEILAKNIYIKDDSSLVLSFAGEITNLPDEDTRFGNIFKTVTDIPITVKRYRIPSFGARKYNLGGGIIFSDNYSNPNAYKPYMVFYENLIKILDGGYEGFRICSGTNIINAVQIAFEKPRKLYIYISPNTNQQQSFTPYTLEAYIHEVVVDTESKDVSFIGEWINDCGIDYNYEPPTNCYQWFYTDNIRHKTSQLYGGDNYVNGTTIVDTIPKGNLIYKSKSDGWITLVENQITEDKVKTLISAALDSISNGDEVAY